LTSSSSRRASTIPSALAGGAPAADADQFPFPNFQQVMQDAQVSSIDLLRDVELNVKIELGRSRMLVEDVLKLGEGSVVELDKLAGDPVDVFVNDRPRRARRGARC
jgi:flagellar motor switch protein FliN/FliY